MMTSTYVRLGSAHVSAQVALAVDIILFQEDGYQFAPRIYCWFYIIIQHFRLIFDWRS